ncbi:MAG: DUF167 family protein [Candidatus Altiarchaeota archaeon]
MDPVRHSRDGTLIDVQIVPKSSRESIRYSGGQIRVWVKSPPEKNKANSDVQRILEGVFGECRIVRGHSSRRKTILLERQTLEKVLEKLDSLSE